MSSKYLSINSLHHYKLHFYHKLSSKYTAALVKYHKHNSKHSNYKEEVIKWLYSMDIEDRMIICSVENKLYTSILKRIYSHYLVNHNYKYRLYLEKEDYEKIPKKNDSSKLDDNFLNEIRFYQSESSRTDYELFSNYFTLSRTVLEDEKLFRDYFNIIANNKCFVVPISTMQIDSKTSVITLPDWIENEATLSEYFVALIEQAISIRYILTISSEANNLNEVHSSSFLKELFNTKKELEAYLLTLKSTDCFRQFAIEQLINELFTDQKLKAFISSKPNNTLKTKGWFANPILFTHNELNEDIKAIRKWSEDLFSKDPQLIITDLMFFHISKLFTYDAFLFRGIIEAIAYKYGLKNSDDLLLNENNNKTKAKSSKNKKKKNKKKATVTSQIKVLVYDLINSSVEISIKNRSIKSISDKSSTEERNKKQKHFFLFNTIERKKEKTKTLKQKNDKSDSDLKLKNEQSTSTIQIEEEKSNHKTEVIITNSNSHNHLMHNTISDDMTFTNHFHNSKIEFYNKLNEDIEQYYLMQDELLSLLHQVKSIITEHIKEFIQKINPEAEIEIFGSCRNNLVIESSDLDLSITTSNTKLTLDDYLSHLKTCSLFESIFPVLSATIPVVKLKLNPLTFNDSAIASYYDTIYNSPFYKDYLINKEEVKVIKIDLSLNTINAKQILFITNTLSTYPEIRRLVKIIKRLLQLNNLNNSYHGGLCSYSLFLLIYSYVKWSDTCVQNRKRSIASLLFEILMHYGFITDFTKTIINSTLAK